MNYNRIKEVMKEQKITQQELAKRTKLLQPSISRMYKTTQPVTLENIFTIAKAVGVPAYTLIGDYNPIVPSDGKKEIKGQLKANI